MNMNAIITGSSKGIGKAIAMALLKEGWNVALSSRNMDDLEKIRAEANAAYPDQQCLIHKVDFRRKEETISYGRMMKDTWPELDLLVNNVGIFIPDALHKEEDGVLEKMIETNLYSAYFMTREVIAGMMSRRKGCIINMCSIASFMAYPNGGSYTISKFGLLGFSKVLREEMKPYGVKVTSLLLGSTWTDSWKGADFPEDRLMKPEDVVEAVLAVLRMSPASVVEEILIRPQLGDLP